MIKPPQKTKKNINRWDGFFLKNPSFFPTLHPIHPSMDSTTCPSIHFSVTQLRYFKLKKSIYYRNLTYSAPLYVDITKTVVKDGQDPIETQHQKTFIGKEKQLIINGVKCLKFIFLVYISSKNRCSLGREFVFISERVGGDDLNASYIPLKQCIPCHTVVNQT